jgi:hypothetical protein
MGRIAGESRSDARIRKLFDAACQTLALLMTDPEVEPAVRLRAASVVFRVLADGAAVAATGQYSNGKRVTWEEFIKLSKAAGPADDKADKKPEGSGDTEH